MKVRLSEIIKKEVIKKKDFFNKFIGEKLYRILCLNLIKKFLKMFLICIIKTREKKWILKFL